MYEFPEAVLTNHYKRCALKQPVLKVMTNECPWGSHSFWMLPEGNLFSYLLQFLRATSVPWLAAPSSPHYNFLRLCHYLLYSFPSPPSYRVSPQLPWELTVSLSLKILNLITSAKSHTPCKVTCSQVPGVRLWMSLRAGFIHCTTLTL